MLLLCLYGFGLPLVRAILGDASPLIGVAHILLGVLSPLVRVARIFASGSSSLVGIGESKLGVLVGFLGLVQARLCLFKLDFECSLGLVGLSLETLVLSFELLNALFREFQRSRELSDPALDDENLDSVAQK